MALEALTEIQNAESRAAQMIEDAHKEAAECIARANQTAKDRLTEAGQAAKEKTDAAIRAVIEKTQKDSEEASLQATKEAQALQEKLFKKQEGAVRLVLQTILEA